MSHSGHWFGHVNHCKPTCFILFPHGWWTAAACFHTGTSRSECGKLSWRLRFSRNLCFCNFFISLNHLVKGVFNLWFQSWPVTTGALSLVLPHNLVGERPGAAEDDELPWSPGASVPCGFFCKDGCKELRFAGCRSCSWRMSLSAGSTCVSDRDGLGLCLPGSALGCFWLSIGYRYSYP